MMNTAVVPPRVWVSRGGLCACETTYRSADAGRLVRGLTIHARANALVAKATSAAVYGWCTENS